MKSVTKLLHPALRKHVKEDPRFGPILHSPFCIELFLNKFTADMCNEIYLNKRKAIASAINNSHLGIPEDLTRFIWLHERPYRVDAFIKGIGISHRSQNWLKFKQPIRLNRSRWRILRDVWVDQENIFENYSKWKQLLKLPRDYSGMNNDFMTPEESSYIQFLARQHVVYRGSKQKETLSGLSWTLSHDTAKFFADRFGQKGIIKQKTISSQDIYAYISSRGEEEIILLG